MSTRQPAESASPKSGALKLSELLENATPGPAPSDLGSPLTTATSFSHGNAPHYWYDLIAEDAVKNIDNYNFLTTSRARWSFEPGLAVRLSEQATKSIERRVPDLHHSPKASFVQGSTQAVTETSGPSYARLSISHLSFTFLSPDSYLSSTLSRFAYWESYHVRFTDFYRTLPSLPYCVNMSYDTCSIIWMWLLQS